MSLVKRLLNTAITNTLVFVVGAIGFLLLTHFTGYILVPIVIGYLIYDSVLLPLYHKLCEWNKSGDD